MQVRAININGKKLTQKQLDCLTSKLTSAIKRSGFLTTVSQVNSSRIDIKGGHSGVSNIYATIDTKKRGYNYRVNAFTANHCKLGYKKTNVLTWDQRVELNNLINSVLDSMKVSATIASRGFKVRDRYYGKETSWDVEYYYRGQESFQPNYLDWIYSDQNEAHMACILNYKEKELDLAVNDFVQKRDSQLRLVMGGK